MHSPCISVCNLDEQDVCMSCGRTLYEIQHWSSMTEKQQRIVYDNAAIRASYYDEEE